MIIKELINEIDVEKDAELYQFLKSMPDTEELTLDSIRKFIDNGTDPLTRTDLIFLFLEALIKRVKGGNEEW